MLSDLVGRDDPHVRILRSVRASRHERRTCSGGRIRVLLKLMSIAGARSGMRRQANSNLCPGPFLTAHFQASAVSLHNFV
jgi:hypothetical protein